jgi:hypothetical protein
MALGVRSVEAPPSGLPLRRAAPARIERGPEGDRVELSEEAARRLRPGVDPDGIVTTTRARAARSLAAHQAQVRVDQSEARRAVTAQRPAESGIVTTAFAAVERAAESRQTVRAAREAVLEPKDSGPTLDILA